MRTATIGRPTHKPAARKPPAAPAETTRHVPAASAKPPALPAEMEACGTMYDTVLSCTLDIEIWTSN